MAALAASAINALDKAYPQVPFGPWSIRPWDVAWASNSSGDTAEIVVTGKVKGVIAGACAVSWSLCGQVTIITLTSKAASLGTQLVLILLEVGR